MGWVLPAILGAFLLLYVQGIRSGAPPETALIQAGVASAILALLARVAMAIVSIEPQSTGAIDVTASSMTIETSPDGDDQMSLSDPPIGVNRDQQEVAVN